METPWNAAFTHVAKPSTLATVDDLPISTDTLFEGKSTLNTTDSFPFAPSAAGHAASFRSLGCAIASKPATAPQPVTPFFVSPSSVLQDSTIPRFAVTAGTSPGDPDALAEGCGFRGSAPGGADAGGAVAARALCAGASAGTEEGADAAEGASPGAAGPR